jgi:1-acyl-sn-glycerol-3-phosphate acyltransferase
MHVLRSLIFYIVFYGGSALLILGAVLVQYVVPGSERAACDTWSGFHHWCVEKLLGIRVEITGTMPEGAAFYALKHESIFEAIEIPHIFDHPSGFAKKELFEIPGWGRMARRYGGIPVARDEGAKALRYMLREVRPLIEQQRPILIFPEGTRIAHGNRPRLQAGFAALYKLIGLPVIPVAVNSGPLYQRLWKKSGTIRVHFGEPIPPGLSREEVERRTHEAINALNTPVAQSAAPD